MGGCVDVLVIEAGGHRRRMLRRYLVVSIASGELVIKADKICMHACSAAETIVSRFLFGVDAGGCMQGRVAYRSRRVATFTLAAKVAGVDDRVLMIENVLAMWSAICAAAELSVDVDLVFYSTVTILEPISEKHGESIPFEFAD